MSSTVIEVPLRITIEIGPQTGVVARPLVPSLASAAVATAVSASALERVDIDPNYANRKGYDADFLGLTVSLPPLNDEQRRNAAKNSMAKPNEDSTLLPYHHFTVVMNRRRQLAYYTAVNIDGGRSRKPDRSGDRWYFDARIAESEQIGEDLYARNQLDRGHLVRRLDPAWGGAAEALNANNDTFHFTNCSPQHARFNQNSDTWQGIENYLLAKATEGRRKLTIFTGPVMAEDDPLYRGVRLPVRFWKIAVLVKEDDTLSASAYLLDQEELIAGLERFDPDTWQVSVDEIIERTGLDFSGLLPHQVDLGAGGGLDRFAGRPRRKLPQLSAIAL